MLRGLKLAIIMIFCLACLVFVLSAAVLHPETNDSVEYQNATHNLLKNNLLYAGEINKSIDYRLFSKRTAGYPLFLIFQNNVSWVVGIASALLLILNYFLGLGILRTLTKKRKANHTYSLIFLLNVPLFLHTSFVMADLLLASIINLAVFVHCQKQTPWCKKIVTLSVLWCLGVLVKPVILPSILLSPIVFAYLGFKQRKFYFSSLLPGLVFVLVSFFNQQQTGVFEYSSISTINLGQYNSKLLISEKYGYDSAQSYALKSEFMVPRNKDAYLNYKKNLQYLATETIFTNWPSYLKIHLLGSVKMILDPGRYELCTFLGITPSAFSLTEMIYAKDWQKLKLFMFSDIWVLLVFAVLFIVNVFKFLVFAFCLKELREHLFFSFIFLYFFAVVGPVGAARFMLPISVLYLVFCSVGWARVSDFFQKRSKS